MPGTQTVICGIYVIRNCNKVYVGHSADIQQRWKQHKSRPRRGRHRNRHLQNAWNKYGEGAFEFLILEECPRDIELLLEREQHHIDANSDNYNLAPVAGSTLGYRHTDETKARMSASRMGHEVTPEARAKMSAAAMGSTNCVGRILSPETRAKMSASQKGRELSPEHRTKIGEANRRRVITNEARANMSAAQKERWARERAAKSADADGALMSSSSTVDSTDNPASL